MGTKDGALSGLAERNNAAPPDGGRLTPEQQRANLVRVNARLGIDDYLNPNMADTDAHLVEHGFMSGS